MLVFLLFLGARAGRRYSLFLLQSTGSKKELKHATPSLAHGRLLATPMSSVLSIPSVSHILSRCYQIQGTGRFVRLQPKPTSAKSTRRPCWQFRYRKPNWRWQRDSDCLSRAWHCRVFQF